MSCQFCQLLESNGLDSTSAANSMAIKAGNENSIVIRKHYIIYILCKINDSSNNFSQMWHGPYIYCRTNLCRWEAEGFQRFQVSSNVVCQRFCRPWVIRCPNRWHENVTFVNLHLHNMATLMFINPSTETIPVITSSLKWQSGGCWTGFGSNQPSQTVKNVAKRCQGVKAICHLSYYYLRI